MKVYGLVGFQLSHSFSSSYFNEKFFKENIHNCHYELFPIQDIADVKKLVLNHPQLRGFNITIPFKEQIIPYLTYIDETAEFIGAVNTVSILNNDDFILHGYNTDIFGFEETVTPFLKNKNINALILGTGGASKAVAFVLDKHKIPFKFVTRNKKNDEQLEYKEITQEVILSHKLIINTTPSGMYPEILTFPDIPYHYITKEHILYDLVYNPSETIFMKRGIERGAIVKNGMEMLYMQAEKSWEIWNPRR